MNDVVNLNRARKKKAAAAKEKTAQENRVKFGRTKGEKARDALLDKQRTDLLDGAKRGED